MQCIIMQNQLYVFQTARVVVYFLASMQHALENLTKMLITPKDFCIRQEESTWAKHVLYFKNN